MLEDPQILHTTAQDTAVLALRVRRSEIQDVMGPGLAEVKAAVTAQGVAITGPWFTHHLQPPGEFFDFEICVPVASPIAESGRVRAGAWPAGEVARTVYQGSYDKLGGAWSEFDGWIVANGYTPCPDLWERYLVDPGTSPDPGSWRTELTRPLT